MKRFLSAFLALCLFPVFCLADLPDISGLTFDELIELKSKINLALWSAEEWQEVTIPAGLYQIGVDIPAGHWTITPCPDIYCSVWYGDVINDSGTGAGYGWDLFNGYNECLSTRVKKDGSWKDPETAHSVDLVMKEGWYFSSKAPVIFTPYTGKPDLGFK